MQKPTLIHLEHAMPPLSELGLEHLIPVLMGGGTMSQESLSAILEGLADGARKRAARRLVAVSRATGEQLLAWEVDQAQEAEALKAAALLPFSEAQEAITSFFASAGLSLTFSPVSSEMVGKAVGATAEPPVVEMAE